MLVVQGCPAVVAGAKSSMSGGGQRTLREAFRGGSNAGGLVEGVKGKGVYRELVVATSSGMQQVLSSGRSFQQAPGSSFRGGDDLVVSRVQHSRRVGGGGASVELALQQVEQHLTCFDADLELQNTHVPPFDPEGAPKMDID